MEIYSVNDLLLVLKQKYNYCDELLSFLSKVVPTLVYIFGEDKINHIYNALIDCEIHIQREGEDPQKYFSDYYEFSKELGFPTFVAGVHFDELLLDANGNVYKKEMIYMRTDNLNDKKFDFSNTNSLATMVHEICHLIKSYNNLSFDGDIVISYSGLIKKSYRYDSTTNSFVLIDALNVGFEEALNTCDEEDVMKIAVDPSYKTTGYRHECEAARYLLVNDEFRSTVRSAQLNYSDDWKNVLGVDESNKLIESFDSLINIYYLPAYDFVKRKEELKKQKSDAFACLKDIIDNMNNKNLNV